VKMLREHPDVTRRLRALWTLHCIGSTDEGLLTELLNSPEEYLRSWALQLELEDRQVASSTLAKLTENGSSRFFSGCPFESGQCFATVAPGAALGHCRRIGLAWRRRDRRLFAVDDLVFDRAAGADEC